MGFNNLVDGSVDSATQKEESLAKASQLNFKTCNNELKRRQKAIC